MRGSCAPVSFCIILLPPSSVCMTTLPAYFALTSPITLWAVLKSVAYAWQQQSLTDDAKMLFDLSRELYERFAVLGERATKLGSAITKTVGAYNSFAASLESRVLVTARKLQRVDQSKVIGTVDMIVPEKGDIRELSAPETNAE